MPGGRIEPRDVPVTREEVHALVQARDGNVDLVRADLEANYPDMVDRYLLVEGAQVSVIDLILTDLESYL